MPALDSCHLRADVEVQRFPGTDAPDGGPPTEVVLGESPWPMAIAVVVLMVAALASGSSLWLLPGWMLAAAEGGLLLALLMAIRAGRPRTLWLRRTTIALVVLLLGSTLVSTSCSSTTC